MRNNNGTLLRAKSSVVQGKVRNAALQSILLNYWSGEKQKANMKTRITYFYFKSAACCKSNTKHKHLLVKMVLKCYFCWTIILSYEHYTPVLPPLRCYWLLLKHLKPAVCVMVYCLNTQGSHQLLAKFAKFLIRFFFSCQLNFSWSWRGGTVHKKADLHSLQRLCANMATKGQSGWKLCDYNDSKYVL